MTSSFTSSDCTNWIITKPIALFWKLFEPFMKIAQQQKHRTLLFCYCNKTFPLFAIVHLHDLLTPCSSCKNTRWETASVKKCAARISSFFARFISCCFRMKNQLHMWMGMQSEYQKFEHRFRQHVMSRSDDSAENCWRVEVKWFIHIHITHGLCHGLPFALSQWCDVQFRGRTCNHVPFKFYFFFLQLKS